MASGCCEAATAKEIFCIWLLLFGEEGSIFNELEEGNECPIIKSSDSAFLICFCCWRL